MKEMIEIFRMTEIPAEVRADIIIRLGVALDNQYAMNWTTPVVYRLVEQLCPNHEKLADEWFIKSAEVKK